MIDAEKNRDYADFGMGEFICDAFFQNWIIHPDEESNAFWEAWIREHPEKADVIGEARMLLVSMHFMEELPGDAQVQRSLAGAIDILTHRHTDIAVHRPVRRIGRVQGFRWAAAVLIGICVCASLYYYIRERGPGAAKAYVTHYGEIRTLYLPDSSRLVLNAHSTVHYAKNWGRGIPREVWLDGEAFFDVRRPTVDVKGMDRYEGFLVHTKSLTIEVLGTSFDIRERRGKTEVVLQSGKIRVQFVHGEHADLLMSPGEKLTYDPENVALARTVTIPEHYTSWKDKRLTDITVGEIAEYIEDNFGRKVILADPSMAAKAMGGTVLLDNLDDALFALSAVLDVNIIQKKDTLILRPR